VNREQLDVRGVRGCGPVGDYGVLGLDEGGAPLQTAASGTTGKARTAIPVPL
jgi:hypothetical protein